MLKKNLLVGLIVVFHHGLIKGNTLTTIPNQDSFDGILFVPTTNEHNAVKYTFFSMPEEFKSENKINSNLIGDCWELVLFRSDSDGSPEFVERFAAVFADPYQYLMNIKDLKEYGVIVRKTDKSSEWLDKWTKTVLSLTLISKLKKVEKTDE